MLSIRGPHLAGIVTALALALLVLLGAAASRGTEYDEDYSIFIAAGTPRPVWPAAAFTPLQVRPFFTGHSNAIGIARDLRQTDVHPPLYFWSLAAWRGVVGPGLFRSRVLSVLFSVAALGGVASLAILCGAPPVAAILLTVGCYGFAYTGSIARGFALAQLCVIWGTVLLVRAARTPPAGRAAMLGLAGGIVLGLATFTNYLAAFAGAAALLWLLLLRPGRVGTWLAAGVGFACILPLDMFFFLAQRGSRAGQFPPFRLLPSLERLGQYTAANVFGGLPLYVGHRAGLVVGGLLVLALLALFGLIGWRWRRIATPASRTLLAMAAVATPIGLLLLGLVFNNTPIELRYIAFATPFLTILAAGGFASLGPRRGSMALGAMLAVQALSLAGMMLRPETMQPQAQAARAAAALSTPASLTLVPYGNDGVGVLAAFVNEAPPLMRIRHVDPGVTAEALRGEAGTAGRVVLVLLGLDGDSRAVLPLMRSAFADDRCWKPAGTGFDVLAYDRVPACHGGGVQ